MLFSPNCTHSFRLFLVLPNLIVVALQCALRVIVSIPTTPMISLARSNPKKPTTMPQPNSYPSFTEAKTARAIIMGSVIGVVGVVGCDFSTPRNSAVILSRGVQGRKNLIAEVKHRTSELLISWQCCPAKYPRNCSLSTSYRLRKKQTTVAFTDITNAITRVAYRTNVLFCTR